MVSFNCSQCGDTIKKKKAEQHLYKCRHAVLSCVDCGREFRDSSYAEHFTCLTEAQKYEKPGTQFEQSKGERVQKTWFENVQAACASDKCSPMCRELLRRLQDYPNTPRKRPKFMSFVTNSIRGFRAEHIEEAWNIISEVSSKKQEENVSPKCNGQGDDIPAAEQQETEESSRGREKHNAKQHNGKSESANGGAQENQSPLENVDGVKKKKSKREVCTESYPQSDGNVPDDSCTSDAVLSKKEKKKRKKVMLPNDADQCQAENTEQPEQEVELAAGEGAIKKKHKKHHHAPVEAEDPLLNGERKKKRHNTEADQSEELPPTNAEEKEVPQGDVCKKKKKHKRKHLDPSEANMLTTNC